MNEGHISEYPIKSEGTGGTVTFAPDVVATIAGLAANEIEGVASMSTSSGWGDVLSKKQLTKGVKVDIGAEEVAVDFTMVLDYGHRIPEVTRGVQENVKKAIENMTGLRVVEVNIYVSAVRFQKELPPPIEEPVPMEEEADPFEEEVADSAPPAPPRVK